MRRVLNATCVLAVMLATAAAGCGEAEDPGEGLADSVDKARAASAFSSLQTGLVTLTLVQIDAGGASGEDLVAELQAKDPTHRYTTAVPTEIGVVQVLGGAGGPVMLVALSEGAGGERPAQYVAAWQGSGSTIYYAGAEPPAYVAEQPAGAGWSSTVPQ